MVGLSRAEKLSEQTGCRFCRGINIIRFVLVLKSYDYFR